MEDLLYKEEVYIVIGAAMEVYDQLDPRFLDAVYQEAFEIELIIQNIQNQALPELPITTRV